MPVDNDPNKIILNSNGVTTTFTFPYKYFTDTDLVVKTITPAGVETLAVLNTDYTVSSGDPSAGCDIVFGTAPDTGTVLIKRELPLSSDANFRPVAGFPEQVITDSFDASVMRDQDLQEQIGRTVTLPEGSSLTNLSLPIPEAGKTLVWNDDEDGFDNSEVTVNDISTAVSAAEASASAAATSETNAATSETNAAASAVSADEDADRAEAAASSLEGILPESGDEGKFYQIDETSYTNGVIKLTKAEVAGKVIDRTVTQISTCSTASATTEKEVTLSGFSLATGATIQVTFDNANTATAPTLNVNSTGAIAIYDESGNAVSSTNPAYFPAGAAVEFTYNGTYWVYKKRVVENYVNGTEWYRIYSDGWIEQGGYFTGTTAGTLNFPLEFSDTSYSLTHGVTSTHGGYAGASFVGENIRYTTGFTYKLDVYTPARSWYACGY